MKDSYCKKDYLRQNLYALKLKHLKEITLALLIISTFYRADSQEIFKSDLSEIFEITRDISLVKSNSDTIQFNLSRKHLLYLGSGFARHIERDDAVAPFIYRGSGIPIEIKYSINGQKSSFSFSFFIDQLVMQSDLPDFGGTGPRYYIKNSNVEISSFYNRLVFSSPKHKLDFFIGGGLNFLLNYRLHNTVLSGGKLSYLMLDQFNSLALMVQVNKGFGKKNRFLTARIYFPAISYVVPVNTYNAYVGETIDGLIDSGSNVLLEVLNNGEWVSLNKLMHINTDLTFARFLGDRLGFELRYSFQYYRFTQFPNLNYSVNLRSGFQIGIIYKLK